MALWHSSPSPLSPIPIYLSGVTVFFLSSRAMGQDGKFTRGYLQSLRAHHTVLCSTSLSHVISVIILIWPPMTTHPSNLSTQKPLAKLSSPVVHSQHFLLTHAVFFLHKFSPMCQSTAWRNKIFRYLPVLPSPAPPVQVLRCYYWAIITEWQHLFTTAYSIVAAVPVVAWYSEPATEVFVENWGIACMQIRKTKKLVLVNNTA